VILWTDIESTGLLARTDHLLEVALVATDDSLVETAATSVVCLPVGFSEDMIEKCHPVVREMHSRNGLWDEVRACTLHRYEAEQLLVKFLTESFANVPDVASHDCVNCRCNEKDHLVIDGVLSCLGQRIGQIGYDPFAPKMLSALSQTPLAGSTVGFDRGFINEHMPSLGKCWHYRSIDVSTITELAKRWAPEVYKNRPKQDAGAAHRALADVRESINYLRYFRDIGFINVNTHKVPWPPRDAIERTAVDPMQGFTEYCTDKSGSLCCTRPVHTTGDHVAGNAEGLIVARWLP